MYKAINLDLLGETLLLKTLSSAYYALTQHPIYKNSKRFEKGSADLAFIVKDSGIHKIITTFGLSLNPDTLQQQFFYYVEVA